MSEYSTGGKECKPERKGNVPQQARKVQGSVQSSSIGKRMESWSNLTNF